MMITTCRIEGCDKKRKGQSRLCSMHQARLYRTGTTDPQPTMTQRERFESRINKSGNCWVWTGSVSPQGYGKLGDNYVHRLAWSFATGQPIAPGLVIDHKCHNRLCVNPKHLQVVSHTENVQNHSGPPRNNKSGYRGVSWSKVMEKWQACASHNGVTERAYFDHIEDAAAEVVRMRNRMHTNNLLDRVAS